MIHYLRNDKDPKKRVNLASNNGLFNFEQFMTTNEGHGGTVFREAFYNDASAAATAHGKISYMDHQRPCHADGYEEEATDFVKKDEENNIEEEEEEEGLIPATKKRSAKLSLEKSRQRILNCMVYDNVLFNKNVDPNTLGLKLLMCDKLRVDDRVYEQLCNLVDQLTSSKDMTMKGRVGKERVSALDEMIASVEIDFNRVVDICADRMVQHCKKCPIVMLDNKNERLFKKVLDLLAGKVSCTASCINATLCYCAHWLCGK
ncbi:hypothetical protein O3P69_014207 [Scylla paramamosain]|uniref:Uncharacterized protein n=1 Tax=Scylla paramamosain TaxID=85552 RepID=A0AAW0SA82_SCYPA